MRKNKITKRTGCEGTMTKKMKKWKKNNLYKKKKYKVVKCNSGIDRKKSVKKVL